MGSKWSENFTKEEYNKKFGQLYQKVAPFTSTSVEEKFHAFREIKYFFSNSKNSSYFYRSVELLYHISKDKSIASLICSRDVELVPVLIKILEYDQSMQDMILEILSFGSETECSRSYTFQPDTGYLAYLKSTILQLLPELTNGEYIPQITSYLRLLQHLTFNRYANIYLCNEVPDLLLALKSVLNRFLLNPLVLSAAIPCLENLASNEQVAKLICSRQLELIPLLIDIIHLPDSDPNISEGIDAILACYLVEFDDSILAEFNHLEFYRNLILSNEFNDSVYHNLGNCTSSLKISHLHLLIDLGLPELLLQQLEFFGTEYWDDQETSEINWTVSECLTTLVNITSISKGADMMRDCLEKHNNGPSLLIMLMNHYKNIIGWKATIILINLYSTTNGTYKRCNHFSLEANSEMCELLFLIFNTSMNFDDISHFDGSGYQYGDFELRNISRALRNLSMDASNLNFLLSRNPDLDFLSLVEQAMQAFIDNRDAFSISSNAVGFASCGGGGGDFDTIENLLEFLLQIYLFEGCERFQPDLAIHGEMIGKMIRELLNIPDDIRHIPFQISQLAHVLLQILPYAG